MASQDGQNVVKYMLVIMASQKGQNVFKDILPQKEHFLSIFLAL